MERAYTETGNSSISSSVSGGFTWRLGSGAPMWPPYGFPGVSKPSGSAFGFQWGPEPEALSMPPGTSTAPRSTLS